ncbi:MAG: hypothetical protein WC027_01045 [Candidatus Paceibacterota bacterium]
MKNPENKNEEMVSIDTRLADGVKLLTQTTKPLWDEVNGVNMSEQKKRLYKRIFAEASLGLSEVTMHFPFPVEKIEKYTMEHENDVLVQDEKDFTYRIQIDQNQEFYEGLLELKELGQFKVEFISKKGESSSSSDGWAVKESEYLVARISW